MEFKTILVDLTDDEARDARLDAALTLADWSDGNVVGLSATGPLLDPYRSEGGEALRYEAMRGDMLRRLHAAGDAAIADALVRHPSTAGTSHVVIKQESGWALAVRGMASDIILPGLPGANRGRISLTQSVSVSTTQSISGTSSTVRRLGGDPLGALPNRTMTVPKSPNCGAFLLRRKSVMSTREASLRRNPNA